MVRLENSLWDLEGEPSNERGCDMYSRDLASVKNEIHDLTTKCFIVKISKKVSFLDRLGMKFCRNIMLYTRWNGYRRRVINFVLRKYLFNILFV